MRKWYESKVSQLFFRLCGRFFTYGALRSTTTIEVLAMYNDKAAYTRFIMDEYERLAPAIDRKVLNSSIDRALDSMVRRNLDAANKEGGH